jgi:lysophospholipase L1-like esterase
MEDWQENVKTYSSRVDKVAAELTDVHVIHTNTWGLSRDFDFTDGLHPNTRGAMKVAKLLATEIRKIVGVDFFG